ncbi:MAG: methylated-DNA--[protein]-cysteine S-methyltransferase [Chloroflexi bacterium]|jgi:methylated-DNA-[protein]-cysteine S-methyltransferase|nr:methylated-DNA--[protein]-cysteine S-methyltransferase [Chloroflexota bacterium]
MTERTLYTQISSEWGMFTLVWREGENGGRACRVFLPRAGAPTAETLPGLFPGIQSDTSPAMRELGERIQRFLAGEAVTFCVDEMALEHCSAFQRRVLLAEYAVPRGSVTTYGLLAQHLGQPGAARAVGRALATNPLPILIPCHRAVAADGGLGGFQGGLAMKRALLEREGVAFDAHGRAIAPRMYG